MSLLVRSALTSLAPRRGLALSGHPSLVLQQLWPLYIYAELSFKLALYCELISDSSYFWPKWEPKPNQYNLQPPQSAFKRPPPCRSSSSNSWPGWASRTSWAGSKAQLKLPPKDSRKKTSDVTGSPCTEWSKRSWHHHCKPLSHILWSSYDSSCSSIDWKFCRKGHRDWSRLGVSLVCALDGGLCRWKF